MPRDILDPASTPDRPGSVFTIAAMDDYTGVLSNFQGRFENLSSLPDFWNLSLEMLNTLAPQLESLLREANYQKDDERQSVVLFGGSQDNFIINILNLYDSAIGDLSGPEAPSLPLLDALCAGRGENKKIPDLAGSFTTRLGYPNNQHSLAENQRLAAACLLNLDHGEVMAVNGPPGTGKTSMLLSLIATEFSTAALRQDEFPPLIVAASTNNQAVTNILADFGKIPSEDGIYKRWLPQLNSFGSYFPGLNKKDKAIKDGYITENFFDEVNKPQYLESAKKQFLAQGSAAANQDLNLEKILVWLHEEIKREHQKLIYQQKTYDLFASLKQDLLNDDVNLFKTGVLQAAEELDKFSGRWHEMWSARTWGEKYLYWLPFWGKSLAKKKSNVFESCYPEYLGQKLFNLTLADMPLEAEDRQIKINKFIKAGQAVIDAAGQCGCTGLPGFLDLELLHLDEAFDATIRRRIFWLSVHYWEGRWIQESEKKKNQKTFGCYDPGELARIWKTRMMLTPCAVATFFRLPNIFRIKDNKVINPLYQIIDLLIAEESGQVSPETAGISFALAKRAVVVGDTSQIEPVWGIQGAIDRANAGLEGLQPDDLLKKGQMASSGSVMRMAQSASVFSQELARGLERGLYLVEHRRCLKEIIRYCNDLCYQGILIPKNTGRPSTDIPPMYGLHVEGQAASIGGSRANEKEAAFIAQWLLENRKKLLEAYGPKPLAELVGVVTPFTAQARLIKSSLARCGIHDNITIGTVHSLQGAERPVILFSPVYTKKDSGKPLFFNNAPNMLNVAVSRAKENFIVVGDMRLILEVDSQSPYGRFYELLQFSQGPPENIALYDFPPHLRPNCWLTADQHDEFFLKILSSARKSVVVTSPWVTDKAVQIFSRAITDCLSRGVRFQVITDPTKNTKESHKEGLKLLEGLGAEILQGKNVHAKQLFCDDLICVDGSLNWLSASREERYKQIERAFAQACGETRANMESLFRDCGLDISFD